MLDAIGAADVVLFPPSNPVVSIGTILADDPALAGIEVRVLPLYMRDLPATAAIARAALDLAFELREPVGEH